VTHSTCTTVCVDGYTGGGDPTCTCAVTDVGNNSVGWRGTTERLENTTSQSTSSIGIQFYVGMK